MITRFAPSPTGPLHLGHAYSTLLIRAMSNGGTMRLRLEDTDTTRCRESYARAIVEDLGWLGIAWEGDIRRQSAHLEEYRVALDTLAERGLVYPCSCTRRRIADDGARAGFDGLVYPGTCRGRSPDDARPGDALRLDIRRCLDAVGAPPRFVEEGALHPGEHVLDPGTLIHRIGDPVLRRRLSGDIAYHLACPHDDALQGISHVVRGDDLWHATPVHVLIQSVLGWPVPRYHHHELVRDASGRRLAKIDHSKAIARYRAEGRSPDELRAMLPPYSAGPTGASSSTASPSRSAV